MRTRPSLPAGHGELTVIPAFDEWGALVDSNRKRARSWRFDVAGLDVAELRTLARTETLARADAFSSRLGVPVAPPRGPADVIVATGHQPEFFHPGVWVKSFLLQRLAGETGGSALDIVVDSDGFDSITIESPCMTPGVSRCRQFLAIGTADGCFACTGPPGEQEIRDFCSGTSAALATLPAPSIGRHFAEFCSALQSTVGDAENIAETMTFARRRFESSAGSDYLELPVSSLARSEAFSRFIACLARDARRFQADYNGELADHRSLTGVRSAAQPFPDLATDGARVELPLWLLADSRSRVWVGSSEGEATLEADDGVIVRLPADPGSACRAILDSGATFAPKAMALTMFTRLFCCDLFIHGIGGGRYDRVTDGVIRRFFGVEPPGFVVASMTLYLPLGAHTVTDEEFAQATERLNRLAHNPDALLGEIDFDTEQERARARALAAEKGVLVASIAAPGADKKALGARIREVNEELGAMLEPVRAALTEARERLLALRADAEVLTDRTYPFCFWDPIEIADKVR